MNKKVLHVITVSFVINHFFGKQFSYLKQKTSNQYFIGCSPSDEFFQLSESLDHTPFAVNVTRSISPITDLKAIYRIYKFIKSNSIDTVIGHTPKGGMVAMIAAFFAGVSSRVYFRHGIIYETSNGFKKLMLKNIDRLSGTLAKKVVCVSQAVQKISEYDKLNNPSKNIVLGFGTCNGIDTENKFNPEKEEIHTIANIKEYWQLSEGDFVIGYVGRLVKDKGINELITAYKILIKSYENIKLLLVGPIEERDAISDQPKMIINMDENIISTGFVLDAAPYFGLMDVFVLPTYREGFPTVALKASSMELPVLISRATGCEESIIQVKNVKIESCVTDGIAIYRGLHTSLEKEVFAARNIVLDNVTALNNRRHGGSGDSIQNFLCKNSSFNNNGQDSQGSKSGARGAVFNNTLYGNGWDMEGYGLGSPLQNIVFDDCVFLDNAASGLLFYDTVDQNAPYFLPRNDIKISNSRLNAGFHNPSGNYALIFTSSIENKKSSRKLYSNISISNSVLHGKLLLRSAENVTLTDVQINSGEAFEGLIDYTDNVRSHSGNNRKTIKWETYNGKDIQ